MLEAAAAGFHLVCLNRFPNQPHTQAEAELVVAPPDAVLRLSKPLGRVASMPMLRRCDSLLGDAKGSLGDAKSSLGDAKSSLGDAKSSWVTLRARWVMLRARWVMLVAGRGGGGGGGHRDDATAVRGQRRESRRRARPQCDEAVAAGRAGGGAAQPRAPGARHCSCWCVTRVRLPRATSRRKTPGYAKTQYCPIQMLTYYDC